MSERPRVVLALSPIAERQVEPLIFDHDQPLEILSSVAVADELAREVQEHRPDAVLLSPALSGLTPSHCERLRATGARLVGLALDQHEHGLLDTLGVDETIDSEVSRETLIAAVKAPEGERDDQSAAMPVASSPRAQQERREDHGSVLAVLGVRGAPGASELAASLAALAARRWATVLVEADALGGGLAARLGVDPGDGSLAGLIRAIDAGESGVHELVERWLVQPEGWPTVLLGPSDPQIAGELARPGVMTAALDTLAALYPVVVCDVAFLLTDGQQQQQPVHLHREALINADAVLLVLGSREAQLHAGLRQLDLLTDMLAIPAERVRIIVGQAGGPSSAHKTAITNTITERLADRGLSVDSWLPWDARGARRAEQQGRPIALARQRGPYTRAVNRLLDELFIPASVPKAKRRKRRLPTPAPQSGERDEMVWQR